MQAIWELVSASFEAFAGVAPSRLWRAVLVAAAATFLCIGTFAGVGRLWNREFRPSFTHWVMCGASALSVFVGTLLFNCARSLGDFAHVQVRLWQIQLGMDRAWQERTFRLAHGDVARLGIENTADSPPETKRIPARTHEARVAVATRYVSEAMSHFVLTTPIPARWLAASSNRPHQAFAQTLHSAIGSQSGVPLALDPLTTSVAHDVANELNRDIPRLVRDTRIVLAVVFGVFPLLTAGLLNFAAYRSIRPHY